MDLSKAAVSIMLGFMLFAGVIVLFNSHSAPTDDDMTLTLGDAADTEMSSIFKSKGKISKVVKSATKTVSKDVNTAVKDVVSAIDSDLTPEAICVEAVGMATNELGKSILLKASEDDEGATICAELCADSAAETDAAAGGPEDPVGDSVAAALGLNCAGLCKMAIGEAISPLTDAFGEYICGKLKFSTSSLVK